MKDPESSDQRVQPPWLEPLDHTADAGFTVVAETLPGLFSRAALGMFDLLCDLRSVRPLEAEPVELELASGDLPALLVRWLSELNFRHITERKVFCRFDVTDISERHLKAEARGERIDPLRHTVFTEIKAVTFHGLAVEERGGRLSARVIFDL